MAIKLLIFAAIAALYWVLVIWGPAKLADVKVVYSTLNVIGWVFTSIVGTLLLSKAIDD